jgi:alpha-tubulin suppressor-like RCC1 family protein
VSPGAVTTPTQLYSGVKAVAAGWEQTFLVASDDWLYATGYFGGGSTVGYGPENNSGVRQAAAGDAFVLYIGLDGTVGSAGDNSRGQLGNGTTTARPSYAQFTVANNGYAVGAGRRHGFYIATDGALWAMGANDQGQLGDGTREDRHVPVKVAAAVAAVCGDDDHSLFLKKDGSLWGMGSNGHGQLGTEADAAAQRVAPIHVDAQVVQVAAGGHHTLYLKSDDSLWAVGRNDQGQLGDGSTLDRSTPVRVADQVKLIAAGGAHSLFVKSDGTLWAMGADDMGQLGDLGSTAQTRPVKIRSGVTAIAAGALASYSVLADGTLWMVGRFGWDWTAPQPTPRQIGESVRAVAAGFSNYYFIKSDGTLWGAGSNGFGQRANSRGYFLPDFPATEIDQQVSRVSAGRDFVAYVKTDETLWTRGANASGQLGLAPSVDGGATAHLAAESVRQVWCGEEHVAYLRADETLWTMGAGESGQLGGAVVVARASATKLADRVQTAAAGGRHTVFVTESGVARLANLSALTNIGTGEAVQIAGFVLTGSQRRPMLIRANGPALWPLGVGTAIADPVLQVVAGGVELERNDNWGSGGADAAALTQAFARLGAGPWVAGSADAAVLVTLSPGVFSGIAADARGASGRGLLEVYDAGDPDGDSQLVNLSTRCYVGAGDQVLIAGFVIAGTRSMEVLLRAAGPMLGDAGVPGFLADPTVKLHAGSVVIAQNDNWDADAAAGAAIVANAKRLGAQPWKAGSRDAALLVTLPPGVYSAHVAGAGGTTGVALAEIYLSQ